MNKKCARLIITIIFILINHLAIAQTDTIHFKTIRAGKEYKHSGLYQSLWGRNYRKEWTTSIQIPVMMLDTAEGGLVPDEAGGSHQSKSLHLISKDGKYYTLRSVNKTLDAVVPEGFKKTFVAHIANDEISMSHPYAALSVPIMAKAAGIYHTTPKYVYIPQQPALDSFNKIYGNTLYLFEQRPSGDWKNADNLGNFDKYVSSEKLREKIFEDDKNRADQKAYAKARLFDFFIGDWDRHEDQWKWAPTDSGNKKVYVPVPVDRDQAYSKYNGLLLSIAISAANAKYFQRFDYTIDDVRALNYERRNQDRLLTNGLALDQWMDNAQSLQQSLTDNVIETSIKQMPAEIFAISGNNIIAKLKSRREHLMEYATKYYFFLAKQVELTGTTADDYFEVNRLGDDETSVNIYAINKKGEKKKDPFYTRVFKTNETKEIRLYGFSGNDIYDIEGKVNDAIKVRIIGGTDKDSIIDHSNARRNKLHVYDDANNVFPSKSKAKFHISSDSSIHAFNYDYFYPNQHGLAPIIFYNDEDKFFAGIGYGWTKKAWRKYPFVFKQAIAVNYSISQKAVSLTYKGLFPNFVGKWDLNLLGNYDLMRWRNYFGLGNETKNIIDTKDFYQVRSKEWLANIGLSRKFGNNVVQFSGFYQSVEILRDPLRYYNSVVGNDPKFFKPTSFAGGNIHYHFVSVNDSVVPVKGITFAANAGYTQNTANARSFESYNGALQLYVPLIPKISLAIRAGASTVDGDAEFYQYPFLGGTNNLRGYPRERFRGKTAFYNSNELRFISKVHGYLYSGKAGLFAFYDQGRIWMPSETSSTLHHGYGAGILLSPFNIATVDVTYGHSVEGNFLQIRLNKLF